MSKILSATNLKAFLSHYSKLFSCFPLTSQRNQFYSISTLRFPEPDAAPLA
uniref:Uncharacterized protein n=1 Tax=Kalanchoe fedtschenkoi TaxID=63787 RepID=A0A7N1A8Y8_KALFE